VDEFATLRDQLRLSGTLVLAVKVTPRCATSEVAGFNPEGALQVKLAAVPEKGKANEELRRLLARFFAVPKGRIEILSGDTARHKRIRISR
jgi:hypothetical protein